MEERGEQNQYLGIRDPMPFGNLEEIQYIGDKPVTTIDQREYTFSPVIQADSTVQSTFRNGRTVNFALLPRPTHYVPGATRLGAVYGMMADNRKVGGHYFYIPGQGFFDQADGQTVYRAMKNAADSDEFASRLLKGQDAAAAEARSNYWDSKHVEDENNFQARVTYEHLNDQEKKEVEGRGQADASPLNSEG